MRRALVASMAALLTLGTASVAGPATASPDVLAADSLSWIECAGDAAACPPAPELTSITASLDALTIAWTWGQDALVPDQVTSVVLRVTPGDLEISAPAAASTFTVDDLLPSTDYSVTAFGADGQQLSVASDPVTQSTLADVDTGSAVVDASSLKPMATPGEIENLIVTLKDDVATEAQADAVSDDLPIAGVSVDDTQDLGAGNARLDLSEGVSEADAAVIIDDLEADPRVESVEVDRRVFRSTFPSTAPNDTYWTDNSLWGLYGTYGIGIASSRTTMNSVWTAGQGSGTVVAVLDTGYTAHPDLDANYVAGYDFVRSSSGTCRSSATNGDGDYISTGTYGALGWDSNPLDPGDWTDISSYPCTSGPSSWHGTHVAGTVAGVANNGQGVAGVAPEASIQPVRVLSFDGGWTSDIATAITWASGGAVSGAPTNTTPADVINLSLGGYSPTGCSPTFQTAIDAAVALGSVIVVSAGNDNADAADYSPGNCNNVITVAATTSTGERASYSNYGADVEIAAPGSTIYSTLNSGITTPSTPTYGQYSGTSMSAPHVSGVAALLRARFPSLTPNQVLTTLQGSAQAFPTTGGRDCTTSICGAGLLRADAAATSDPVLAAVSPLDGSSGGGDSVTIGGYNLGTTSAVTFGGTAASITSTSSTSVTVTTPAHAAGAVAIAVTNGTGTTSYGSSFTFHDAPTLSALDIATGTTAGGTSVTLTGTNLSGTTGVTFGGSAATLASATSTTVTVTTPASSAGTVNVVVTTPGGSDTLTSAFTYVAPPAPAPAPSGGGSSSSSSSSAESSGGGGGLNEITQISPSASGAPGSVIALAGWGLTTTRAVMFNDYPATSWRVVSDGHVEVTVPDIPPGVYVVFAVLAPEVGRAAYWTGFHVLPAGTPSAAAPIGASPSDASTSTPSSSTTAGDLVLFKSNSAALTPATRAKLTRLTKKVTGPSVIGTVTTFSDLRGTAASVRVAKARARNITAYLKSQGVTGTISTTIAKGDSSALRKGSIVRLTTDAQANAASSKDLVPSLIVRYRKGVSPTVNGKVRGADLITGGLGTGMTLGPNLGLRMYRVDFASPVTRAQALQAAAQMTKDKGIEFVEPDSIVTAQVTRN